jgi:hypothetical protein
MVVVQYGAGGHMIQKQTWFTTVLVTLQFGTQMYVQATTNGL